jgi:hypothetical protein
MAKLTGVLAATFGRTQPAWLAPQSPIRSPSMSGRARAQAMAAAASSARSSMDCASQSPGAPATPGLSQDREAYPASAFASHMGR